MKKQLAASCLALALAAPAFAEDKPAAAAPAAGGDMMDMSKHGPLSRTPKNEKQDQKELDAYFKANEDASKKGDLDAMADMIDFPVLMATDDASGKYEAMETSKEQWLGMMKPFVEHMKAAKDVKMTMTGKCFLMSDDLASCEGTTTTEMGKVKGKSNSQMLMIRKDGKWKAKTMVEAGWGGMGAPPAAK